MLTDVVARAARPAAKAFKLGDEKGLFLLVQTSGQKLWRLKFRIAGKEKSLSFGAYPEVSLKEARERALAARSDLRQGIDPAAQRKASKTAAIEAGKNTFELIAREWIDQNKNKWIPAHALQTLRSLERDAFPFIGSSPISAITTPAMLSLLRKIEGRGVGDTASRVHQRCSSVFSYAIQTGRLANNPSLSLRGALKPVQTNHQSAIPIPELPELMRKISDYDGQALTRFALRFLALTFVRTGEMRAATWSEFDFDKAEWRIPASRMKMKSEHIVPLSKQALDLLSEIKALGRDSDFVFPQARINGKCMSENTVLFALYRLGYHSRMTGHGFRAVASTVLNENREKGGFNADAIERQLAHSPQNEIRAAYHRSEYLPERKRMMQWWGDYLARIEKGADVIKFASPHG